MQMKRLMIKTTFRVEPNLSAKNKDVFQIELVDSVNDYISVCLCVASTLVSQACHWDALTWWAVLE